MQLGAGADEFLVRDSLVGNFPHLFQQHLLDGAAFLGIGPDIKEEMACRQSEKLRGADKISQAQFFADADEQPRAQIGQRLVQECERMLVGMRQWDSGEGDMNHRLFLRHRLFSPDHFAQGGQDWNFRF